MKFILVFGLCIICFISSTSAQNYSEIYPIAADSSISEIDPYLTYYWYSGWNRNYKTANRQYIHPIWLTFVETDYSNLSRVVAYNIQEDNSYNVAFSNKHIISDTTFESQKYNPIIENFLNRPISIWQESNAEQSDLYYSFYSDSVWSLPKMITNDTSIEYSPLFFTLDAWDLSEQDSENNFLFWISEKSIYTTSLTSAFIWDSVSTLYDSEDSISSLNFRQCPNGDSYLIFNENSSQDSVTLKFFIQIADKKEWRGPFSLFNISKNKPQIEINIYEDYSVPTKLVLTWVEGNYLRDTVFYYSDSLYYTSSYDSYEFEISDSINLTSNTLISGGCVIGPFPYFVFAETIENTTKIYLTESYYNYSYGINYETSNLVSDLTISGLDDNKYFTAWSEFDGKQSDIYIFPDHLIIGDVENNELNNSFSLSQNYPNPFNPTTTIEYTIPNVASSFSSSVSLRVYNVLGQEVATLVNKNQKPGNYKVKFDATKYSSGIYFYQLKYGSAVRTKKMIMMK